jgi:hypothetical protein
MISERKKFKMIYERDHEIKYITVDLGNISLDTETDNFVFSPKKRDKAESLPTEVENLDESRESPRSTSIRFANLLTEEKPR